MAIQEHCDPVFQVESSRRALKPLIGDAVGFGANANVGRKWDQVKSMVHTNNLSVGTVAKAFQKPKRIHYTSNSKYFVLEREKWESHEDVELGAALMPRKSLTTGVMAVIGKDSSKDHAAGTLPSPRVSRRRRQRIPREALDAKWGLQVDAIDAQLYRLDRHIAARHRIITPVNGHEPPDDLFESRAMHNTAGEGALPPIREGHVGSLRLGEGVGLGETRRSKGSHERSIPGKRGDNTDPAASEVDSEEGGWLREEDAIHIPSDAELEAMPVGRALTVLLNAQQRVVCGLGRVEEPWNVRLQKKQAAMKALHPNKVPRVPLFETNNAYNDDSTYATQRHAYLLSKMTELRRKHQAIAVRQDCQLASVSDRVEIEKRHMLMQLFDLAREERRLRIALRKMDDKTDTKGGKKLSAAD